MSRLKFGSKASFLWPDVFTPLMRVGPNEDGGYVLPLGAYHSTRAVISFGVNVDWRFERKLFEDLSVPMILYEDKSVLGLLTRYLLGGLGKFVLGRVDSRVVLDRCSRIIDYFLFFCNSNISLKREWVDASLSRSVFQSSPIHTLLKCDIEGGEYEILESILDNQEKFNIVAIEFHDVNLNLEQLRLFVNTMKENFFLVHLHVNNSGKVSHDGVPDVLELTFGRKELVSEYSDPTANLPLPDIDFPSVQGSVDYGFAK